MADVVVENQTGAAGGVPSANNSVIFVDSTVAALFVKDSAGVYRGSTGNASIAAQGAGFATDTYVTNSNLLIPSFGVQAKSKIRWTISVSKTGAGVVAPAFAIRIGAAGTTADTARLTLTGAAQTAVADVGVFDIILTVRSVSATGVIQGTLSLVHTNAATGLSANDGDVIEASSATFDNTAIAGQTIGLSINAGASAAWTVTQVHVDAVW